MWSHKSPSEPGRVHNMCEHLNQAGGVIKRVVWGRATSQGHSDGGTDLMGHNATLVGCGSWPHHLAGFYPATSPALTGLQAASPSPLMPNK